MNDDHEDDVTKASKILMRMLEAVGAELHNLECDVVVLITDDSHVMTATNGACKSCCATALKRSLDIFANHGIHPGDPCVIDDGPVGDVMGHA